MYPPGRSVRRTASQNGTPGTPWSHVLPMNRRPYGGSVTTALTDPSSIVGSTARQSPRITRAVGFDRSELQEQVATEEPQGQAGQERHGRVGRGQPLNGRGDRRPGRGPPAAGDDNQVVHEPAQQHGRVQAEQQERGEVEGHKVSSPRRSVGRGRDGGAPVALSSGGRKCPRVGRTLTTSRALILPPRGTSGEEGRSRCKTAPTPFELSIIERVALTIPSTSDFTLDFKTDAAIL